MSPVSWVVWAGWGVSGQSAVVGGGILCERGWGQVPSFVVEELAQHLAAHADGTGLMFNAPSGGPIRRTNFRRRIWLPAVRVSVGEPCTFHDLRHTHAALLIA